MASSICCWLQFYFHWKTSYLGFLLYLSLLLWEKIWKHLRLPKLWCKFSNKSWVNMTGTRSCWPGTQQTISLPSFHSPRFCRCQLWISETHPSSQPGLWLQFLFGTVKVQGKYPLAHLLSSEGTGLSCTYLPPGPPNSGFELGKLN